VLCPSFGAAGSVNRLSRRVARPRPIAIGASIGDDWPTGRWLLWSGRRAQPQGKDWSRRCADETSRNGAIDPKGSVSALLHRSDWCFIFAANKEPEREAVTLARAPRCGSVAQEFQLLCSMMANSLRRVRRHSKLLFNSRSTLAVAICFGVLLMSYYTTFEPIWKDWKHSKGPILGVSEF
jgi:hypothetical protein